MQLHEAINLVSKLSTLCNKWTRYMSATHAREGCAQQASANVTTATQLSRRHPHVTIKHIITNKHTSLSR